MIRVLGICLRFQGFLIGHFLFKEYKEQGGISVKRFYGRRFLRLMPAYVVFSVGLLHDTLTGAPLGVSALVFLAVHGIIVGQRRFLVGKSFAVIWLGFSLVAAGASSMNWFLISIFHVTIVDADALFFQYLLSLGIFPMVTWILMRWQRAVLGQY